jgi:hypothetical protein
MRRFGGSRWLGFVAAVGGHRRQRIRETRRNHAVPGRFYNRELSAPAGGAVARDGKGFEEAECVERLELVMDQDANSSGAGPRRVICHRS